MKKLVSSIFIILLIGIIAAYTKLTPVGSEDNEIKTQVQLKKEQIKEYWFSDYMPLIPGLYGIKTHEDRSEQFTSEIVTSHLEKCSNRIGVNKISFGQYFEASDYIL